MNSYDEEIKFIPDLIVVCEPDKIKKNHIEGAPDFIVEVLSPSTKRRDITIKKEIYEKYGVKEYWIMKLSIIVDTFFARISFYATS